MASTDMIKNFKDDKASVSGWVGIFSGFVVAPFTGTFRFVGYGDDGLVVRFDQQIVLDYGLYSLVAGRRLSSGPDDYNPNDVPQSNIRHVLLERKNWYAEKPEVYFPKLFINGLAKGMPINVTKGHFYPIEILYSDVEGGGFAVALFIEQLKPNGTPLKENPVRLPLFRTTSQLPDHKTDTNYPDYDPNSPIWKVVDSRGKPIQTRTTVITEPKTNATTGTKKQTAAPPSQTTGTKNQSAGTNAQTASEAKKKESNTSVSSKEKQKQSAQTKQDSKTVKTSSEEILGYNPDLVVTTAKDIVNDSDKVVSLNEALISAAELGGSQTILFNVKGIDHIETSEGNLFSRDIVFNTTNAATGNDVTIAIKNSRIEGKSFDAKGGFVFGKMNIDISNLTGTNNTSQGNGGLLSLKDSIVSIKDSAFSGNRAPGHERGGGTGYFENCTVEIDNCSFRGGQAYHAGGALFFDEKTIGMVRNCSFTSNRATGYAGALKLKDSEVTIVDSTFEDNSTGYSDGYRWGGGAIQIQDGHLNYIVSEGKSISNTGNHGSFGGFVTICHGSAIFDIGEKGSLIIGTGRQADDYDSFSTNFRDEKAGTSTITKKGKGTMTINAATSLYNGNWIIEDGTVNMNYGGDFAGPITISGGRMDFAKDYSFSQLTITLNGEHKDTYIGGFNHLSGGNLSIIIDSLPPNGTYVLAEGAEGFNKAILVQNNDGDPLGAFIIGKTTKINDTNFLLNLDDGTLSLSVSNSKGKTAASHKQ